MEITNIFGVNLLTEKDDPNQILPFWPRYKHYSFHNQHEQNLDFGPL